jgi:glycosyltransferase involved in cell wall biosynthesis
VTARRRILFVSQFFEPEPVYKGLSFCRGLQDLGYEVDVLTGFPNFPGGKLHQGYKLRPIRRDTIEGVRVTRVPLYPSHDASGLKRALNFLSFFASVTLYLLLRWRRYDLIYVYHPPITVPLAAAVAGLVRRTPLLVEVQDLWPEAVASSGMANPRIVKPIGAACRFVYRRARRIIAQSPGMAAELARRGGGDRVRPVLNWAEEADLARTGTTDLAPYGLEGRFTFVFGGNMGPHQALGTAVEAAFKAAEIEPRIRLVLVGAGVEVEALRQKAEQDGRDIVRVMPGIPRPQVADLFEAADVLLVHLADKPVYAITVPSKTQFYLGMGKPILAGVAGEAAQILRAAKAGIVVPPENVDALAEAMIRLARTPREELVRMGASGRAYYRQNLSFAAGMERIKAVMEEAMTRKPPAPQTGGPLGSATS